MGGDERVSPTSTLISVYCRHWLMSSGGKFTLRLVHAVTPLLYESLLLSLIGDQFEESDSVVGCVLSMRQGEGMLSVWVEEEGEAVRSGALR
jgi:translation initiation factor 4E